MTAQHAIELVASIAMPLIVLAMGLSFYRLARGPSRADRAVALDLLSFLAVGIMGVYAIREDEPVFVDAAIVIVLVNFLATIALARYVGHEVRPDAEEADDES